MFAKQNILLHSVIMVIIVAEWLLSAELPLLLLPSVVSFVAAACHIKYV